MNWLGGRQLHDSNIAITIRFLNYNSYIHTASCVSLDIIVVVDYKLPISYRLAQMFDGAKF